MSYYDSDITDGPVESNVPLPYFNLTSHNFREVDVNERTVTTNSYSLLLVIRFGHYMSNCLFSFLAIVKICHIWVHVLNIFVTFLLLATHTALYQQCKNLSYAAFEETNKNEICKGKLSSSTHLGIQNF